MNIDVIQQYQIIANVALSEAPSGWKKIWIPAEVQDDNSEYSYQYTDQLDANKWFDIQDSAKDYRVHKALKEIRNAMTIPGKTPWSRCTFTLFPDGEFKFDVEYDD